LFAADPDKKILFGDMVQDRTDRYDIALSFSSMLEMIKQRRLKAEQTRLFGDITVTATDKIGEAIAHESGSDEAANE
jgi:segregation and condensation protein A